MGGVRHGGSNIVQQYYCGEHGAGRMPFVQQPMHATGFGVDSFTCVLCLDQMAPLAAIMICRLVKEASMRSAAIVYNLGFHFATTQTQARCMEKRRVCT